MHQLTPLPPIPRHIVGLSGGKDSTALALWLVENEPNRYYEFICNETGNELPPMREHWRKLETLLGGPIIPVKHDVDLVRLCEQMEMLPNWRARWCTRILKIEPTIAFMEALPPGSVLYVGLRADEEEWHSLWANYPEHWAEGVRLETEIGHTFRSNGRDTWPASMRELGEAFASGRKLRKSPARADSCRVCQL